MREKVAEIDEFGKRKRKREKRENWKTERNSSKLN